MWVLVAQIKRTLGLLSQPIGAFGLIPGALVVRGYICQTHGMLMETSEERCGPGSVRWMLSVISVTENLEELGTRIQVIQIIL